ncbi:MAG: hypothetical protein QW743_05520 [Candidatus Methanomethylicia archaeon]
MCGMERKNGEVITWNKEKPRVLCIFCLREIIQRWLDEGFETLERALDNELFPI